MAFSSASGTHNNVLFFRNNADLQQGQEMDLSLSARGDSFSS
jgi:hypothetical protein